MTSRPIRVLELRSVRGTGGGPEKTILMGAARASNPDIAVSICYLRDRRDDVFHIDHRAAPLGVDYSEIVERHSFDLRVVPALRRMVRERGIDIVHAHDYKTDALAFLLAKTERVTALATAHGWTGQSARERHVYYPADRFLLARFPRVVAVSGDIRNELLRAGAQPHAVTVLLNGIDHEAFVRDRDRAGEARRSFGLQADDFVIGAVGRLMPQKRFDLLIDVLDDLASASSPIKLLIAGDGPLRPQLQAQIDRLGLRERCRLVGHLDDVRAFHHALDLFVQSSDYEGTSNAVLEAMAMETPIVATEAGGTREQLEDRVHGLIVPCGDSRSLRAAIEEAVLDRSTSRARADAARARVEGPLSFAARMSALEKIYTDLAKAVA